LIWNKLLILLVCIALLILLVLFPVLIFSRLSTLTGKIERIGDTLSGEIRSNSEDINLIKQNLLLMIEDTGELRSVLQLPVRTYPLGDNKRQDESDYRENRLPLFFDAVDMLLDKNKLDEGIIKFGEFIQSGFIHEIKNRYGFSIKKESDFSISLLKGENKFFEIKYDYKEELFHVSTFLQQEESFSRINDDFNRFIEAQVTDLEQHFRNTREKIEEFLSLKTGSTFQELIKKKDLTYTFSENETRVYLSLNGKKGEEYITPVLDKRENAFFLDGKSYRSFTTFHEDLLDKIKGLDTRSGVEKKIDTLKKEIKELGVDRGFRSFLQSKDLTINLDGREDDEYFYFDLNTKSGTPIGSFAILKHSAELYLMDRDDVLICSFKTLGMPEADRLYSERGDSFSGNEKKN